MIVKKLYNGKNKNPVSLRNRGYRVDFSLCGDAGAGGADFRAGTAILALGGVDDIKSVTFRDGVLGAFSFTGTAGNAVSSDFIRHGCILSIFSD